MVNLKTIKKFPSPLRLTITTVAAVCLAEIFIMLVFSAFPNISLATEIIVDALVVSVVTLIALYYGLYLPMTRYINSQEMLQREIVYRTLHDDLSGLPNRALFTDRVENEIKRSSRYEDRFVLIIFDIDRFKEINDTLGHHNGDKILAEVGQRLKDNWRQSDSIARFGADEFSVMLPGADQDVAVLTLYKLQAFINKPFVIENTPIEVEIHSGIAIYPDHGKTAVELMQHADTALNHAKDRGDEYDVYKQEHDQYSLRKLSLFGDLRRAIQQNELVLYYQPKLNVKKGVIEEVEALIRWEDPVHGLVQPSDFIPLAERTNLIKPLTSWVVSEAFSQIKQWSANGYKVRIAVNLSARNLSDTSIVEQFRHMIETMEIPANMLVGEVTESAVMSQPQKAHAVLAKLHGLGIDLSIDDFGTGYGSLTYLRTLPVKEIKIDQSFIFSMCENNIDQRIVESLIALAHGLDMTVTAEGVESEQCLETLKAMGCDKIQGYVVSKPMTGSALSDAFSDQFARH